MIQLNLQDAFHRVLLHRQLITIKQRSPELFEDYSSRMTSYEKQGNVDLNRALLSADIDIESSIKCIETDARLGFLYALPHAAAIGGALGRALESCLFGSSCNETYQITTLQAAFNIVLDGLMDEAPELVALELETISNILSKRALLECDGPPLVEQLDEKHPVVVLMYKIMCEWVKLVKRAPGWSKDQTVRATFSEAVEAAVLAEYESVDLQLIDPSEGYINGTPRGATISAKSENALLVQGLAPICVRGWPNKLDRSGYCQAVRSLGKLGGWLDDLCDMFIDVDADIWNSALLYVYEEGGKPVGISLPQFKQFLIIRLAWDRTVDGLVETGLQLHDQVVVSLRSLGIDCFPLRALIADVIQSYLYREQEDAL